MYRFKSKAVVMLVLAIVAVSAAYAIMPASAQAQGSCVDCHTNAELLKSMIPEKEEEAGESGET